MRHLLSFTLIITLVFCACSNDDETPDPGPSIFYQSYFFIDNQTPYALRFDRSYRVIDAPAYEVTGLTSPGSELDTVKIYPEDFLVSLILFAFDSLDNQVADYGLDHPVVNEEWLEEERTVMDTVFTDFTIRIQESDLKF